METGGSVGRGVQQCLRCVSQHQGTEARGAGLQASGKGDRTLNQDNGVRIGEKKVVWGDI